MVMDRSLRFGSINYDKCPKKIRFCYGSGGSLGQITTYKSTTYSSTGTRSEIQFFSHCVGAYGIMFIDNFMVDVGLLKIFFIFHLTKYYCVIIFNLLLVLGGVEFEATPYLAIVNIS